MGKGGSVPGRNEREQGGAVMPEDAPGNPGAVPEWADEESGEPDDELVMLGKVRGMQAKLHRWAGEEEPGEPVDERFMLGRVGGMQAKLPRGAGEDSSRRFGDLFNLVCDPDF